MKLISCDIKNQKSTDKAILQLFLHEKSGEIIIRNRPIIIVCPGGGYEYLSDREADIIALQFAAMGYHAAVLRYSVAPAVFPTAVLELGKAVSIIRENGTQWDIDCNKIVLCGFSAGGHLAASYGMFWHKDWIAEKLNMPSQQLRPNAMVLSYPVISSGEFSHEGSFKNLLGNDYEERKKELSLELCVNPDTPPTFLWHTYEDQVVPVQNSLLLVEAYLREHIPIEFHLFEKGGHGLALANELTETAYRVEVQKSAAQWVNLAKLWLDGLFGESGVYKKST